MDGGVGVRVPWWSSGSEENEPGAARLAGGPRFDRFLAYAGLTQYFVYSPTQTSLFFR